MEFGNNDFMHELEQPPTSKNLSCYNIVQLLFMLYFACISGFNLYLQFSSDEQFSISDYFQIFCDTFVFIGFLILIYGIFGENKKIMKIGYLIFFIGCILDLLNLVIDCIFRSIKFYSIINILVALILIFVIIKQFAHI